FQVGHDRKLPTGRYPYGHLLLFNPEKASIENFVPIVTTDPFVLAFQYKNHTFCGMYIKPLDKKALSDALEHMSDILNEFKEVTFFGDFNARHKSFGDHASNTHGTQLIKWRKDNNTRRIAPIGEKWAFIKNNCFSIPDHIISTLNISAFVEHQTDLGDSDHRPIVGIIKSDNPRSDHHIHRFRGWNRFRVKDPDIQEQILHFIGSNVEDICEKI